MIFIYGVLDAHTQSLCLFYIKTFALQKYLCASVLTFLPSVLSSGTFAKNRWYIEQTHHNPTTFTVKEDQEIYVYIQLKSIIFREQSVLRRDPGNILSSKSDFCLQLMDTFLNLFTIENLSIQTVDNRVFLQHPSFESKSCGNLHKYKPASLPLGVNVFK